MAETPRPGPDPVRFVVDRPWWDTAAPGQVELVGGVLRPARDVGRSGRALPRLPYGLLPGLVDHHVHLGLVDRSLLARGSLVEVHDLGWTPAEVLRWRASPPAGVRVRAAGPFHTAVGGYPAGRSWAPPDAVRQVAGPGAALSAVAATAALGVDAIKIALHAGMPLLDDETLRALVGAAHAAGLPALVHAEGGGQAARAVAAGADVLVHAPWDEPLDEALLHRGRGMTWISTVAIHDERAREIAVGNLRRFREVGGRVVYGTDMGNGPLPVGPHAEELLGLGAAGLAGDELLAAVTGGRHRDVPLSDVLLGPAALPASASDLVDWLAEARRLSPLDLQELW